MMWRLIQFTGKLTDLLEQSRAKLDGCSSTAAPPPHYSVEHHPVAHQYGIYRNESELHTSSVPKVWELMSV